MLSPPASYPFLSLNSMLHAFSLHSFPSYHLESPYPILMSYPNRSPPSPSSPSLVLVLTVILATPQSPLLSTTLTKLNFPPLFRIRKQALGASSDGLQLDSRKHTRGEVAASLSVRPTGVSRQTAWHLQKLFHRFTSSSLRFLCPKTRKRELTRDRFPNININQL